MLDERHEAADFAALYAAEAPRLWRAMLAFTSDQEMASDVVSETFAQCLRRGAAVRTPARWLWKSAYRIGRGELRKRERSSGPSEDVSVEYEMPDPDLMIALQQLSARQRITIILHYYAGYSTTEIARIIGVAAPTVRVHLMQGRRRLRQMLGEIDGSA
jgi:RNA polymerase sigma-70 factor (ECF subfamily)